MANKTIPTIQTNEGNVGIGTTNPIASLEVDNSAASLPVLNLGGGEAGNAVSDLYILNSYNNNTGVGYAAKVIGVNISTSLTNQNIPTQRTTWGGVTSATAIALGTDGPRAGTQDNAFQIWTTNDASAGTALTQKFSVTSAGDVGIGTVAPAQKLDVNGAIIVGINNSYGAYSRTLGGVLKPWFATASTNTIFYNTNTSGSIFWQNAADTATLMSLTEQGRLGVNTNDPSGRLHVLDTVLYPPSLTWNAAAATIIRSENGQIAFGSDNTAPYGIWQQVRTTSSTARPLLLNPLGGNVGVGIRDPSATLDVAGAIRVTGVGQIGPAGALGFAVYNDRTNNLAGQVYGRVNGLQFTNNIGFNTLYIASGGYVGIGMTTPIARLQVSDTGDIPYIILNTSSTADKRVRLQFTKTGNAGMELGTDYSVNNANNFYMYDRVNATTFGFFSYNSTWFNANVGIGTVSPLAVLSIGNGSFNDVNVPVQISSAGPSTEKWFGANRNGNYGLILGYYEGAALAGSGAYVRQITTDPLHFAVNNTSVAMSILSNSNVGIGTTNPIGKLTVQGNIEVNYNSITADASVRRSFATSHAVINRGANIAFGLLDGGSGPAGMRVYNVAAAAGAFNSQFITFNTHEGGVNEGERMRITQLGNVGIGTFTPLSLLSVGAAGSTTAASGLTFGGDAQANLYRSAEDTIKTDGALTVAGLIYNNNSAYYSSVTKTAASNWGQYSTILGNNSYLSQIVQVLVNGGNISWAGTFLVNNNISFRPNETWGSVKLLEYANYNCSADDVSLLIASNFPTTGFGSTALVLKTNGTINGGLGTGLANNITVTVNSSSPSSVNLSNSWTNPYPYQIATSVNTKQIYVNENGNVGVGTTTSTYKLNVNGGQFGTSLKGGDLGAGSEVVRMIKSDDTYAMVVRGDGNVGINTSSPSVRLDVVGAARLSSNLLSHKVASYTTSYPGISSFGADATDSNITYYSTGKKVANTFFRGVVWTGKHYIFTDYTNNRAYFYDNNFTQITNAYGYFFVNLPLPSGYINPHGAAWDGRYLWLILYTSAGTSLKIVGYDLDTTNQTATIIAESAVLPLGATYDIEYADGHLYFIKSGTLYIYKWNGSTIDYVSAYANAAGGIDAQAITYDGSYLWATQNGAAIYKIGLDGTAIATISSGFPPDTCGWAWNGSNIVTFDYSARDIYIINTTRLRIDTQNLALMGGKVGIGVTNPGDRVQANLAAGESILANISSNTVSTSNKVGFKLSELGTALGEFSAVRDGTSYQVKLQTLINEPLSFGTSGVTRMVINGSFVGIGSTAPTALLNVRSSIPTSIGATPAGTNVLLDSNTSNYITFRNTADNGTYAGLVFLDNNVGGYVAFGNAGAAVGSDSMIYGAYQDHIFQNNYVNENLYNRTETLRIKQNGNVGIGVTNPTQKLDIVGSYAAPDDDAGILKIRGAGVGPTQLNFGISADGGYAWIQATDIGVDNDRNIILGPLGGNVGIGTTNPLSLLGVGAAGSTTAANGITFGGDAEVNLYRIGENILKTDGNFQVVGSIELRDVLYHYSNIRFLNKAGSNWLTWFTRDTSESEAISRLDYIRSINGSVAGNLGIGTTLPSGKLHVVSSVSNGTVLRADGTNGTLFSVVDDLSDSLMSVNNSAGLPVLEVFADDRVVMGQYGSGDLTVRNNKVGIGTTNPINKLSVIGGASIGSSAYNLATPTNGLLVEGNVGVGTTSVGHPLEVYGTSMDPSLTPSAASIVSINSLGVELAIGRMVTSPFSIWLQGKHATVGGNLTYPITLNPLGGNVGIGLTNPSYSLDVNGTVRAERYRGINSLTLNTYATVNPASNVFLYSQGNDRDSWLYLDSADTSSNWGIYHRQIDTTVSNLPGNSIGFIGGGTNTLQSYIGLANGNGYFAGSVGIGSVAPASKLDVAGNINIDGSSFHRVANDSIITAPSDHGLVAYYGFDEGVGSLIADKTGRNNTSSNGLTYTTTAIRGTALDGFGGDTKYVIVPDSADFDFGTGDFAVSLWCRPNSSFTGVNNTLIEIGLYTAGILIRPQANTNTLEVYAQNVFITQPSIVWTANTWYHIVVTRVNSVLNVYSNGTRIASVANSLNIQVGSAGYIGRSAHASGQFFYGIIDEVKIYKGKGLDYGEVRGQYLSRGDSELVSRIFSNTNGYIGIGTTSPNSLLTVGAAGVTDAANGITFGGDAQANIYRNGEDSLATDGNFNAAGNVNSKNSRTTTYTSLTGGSNGSWYPLFQVNDAADGMVTCNIRTYAHGSASFIATKGYGPSLTHTITVLNFNYNPNGGFANIIGIRIRESGWVEIQLAWSSGPTVDIGAQIIGTNYTPTFAATLTVTSAVDAIVDTAYLSQGMLRSYGNIITAAGSVGIGTTNPTNRLHVVETTPTGSRIQLGSTSTNSLMNAGLVNDFLILTAPFNAAPASTSNNNAKWGIKMGGGSTDAPNALEKSACIYAVSEDSLGYNRSVGLALHTSPFDLPNVERVRINSVGNVGIGLTNPSYKLVVSGGDVSIASANNLKFGTVAVLNTSNNADDIYANVRVIRNESTVNQDGMFVNYNSNGTTAAHLRFFANATNERMRIDASNGNVGIGVTNPTARLQVANTGTITSIATIRIVGSTGNNAGSQVEFYKAQTAKAAVGLASAVVGGGTSDDLLLLSANPASIVFNAGANGLVAFKSDGNVGIGLTNPAAARLHIKGNTTDPVLRVETALLEAGTTTSSKTFVAWLPIMTGAAVGDKVFIPLFK